MTRSSLLKKFDTKVQTLYDSLYDVKELLDSTEDYELESAADQFVEDIEEVLSEGEASVEAIKGLITDVDED
jgi:regulator of sirC expression with transglutaminase-like and TPR domain|tara:strand:- start:630 stop:845 length:216 start_codon:yes stop_codon:yes gene_type:complete